MNTLQDTLSTLDEPVRKLVGVIMEKSREIFNDKQSVAPVAFVIPPGSDCPVVIEIPELTDECKPGVWKMLRSARMICKTVAFVSEVWQSHPKPGDGLYDNETKQFKIMPRDDPNHTEAVMVQLWEGRRIITFRAQITRNPDKMGDWEAYYDSFFPKNGIENPKGAMMDGEPYALDGN